MDSAWMFERWIERQVGVLTDSAGRPVEELIDAPEEAARTALGPQATFALGMIAGAARTLDVTPRELLEQLELLEPATRRRAAASR